MGQEYSAPRPNVKLQVIGAGLPRTGTASFCKALEILLKGPVYHGGTQITLGPEHEIRTWLKIASQWPPHNDATKSANDALVKSRLDGFVATTDYPAAAYIPELARLYPDAKVICTTRDVDSWVKSMGVVVSIATMKFMRILFMPIPALRHFADYVDAARVQWFTLYGEIEPLTERSYNRHVEWLRDVVPEERLMFFDVKDGWEPLCAALGVPVPDVPFPRINDGKAVEKFAKRHVGRALRRWALIVGVAAAVAFGVSKALR